MSVASEDQDPLPQESFTATWISLCAAHDQICTTKPMSSQSCRCGTQRATPHPDLGLACDCKTSRAESRRPTRRLRDEVKTMVVGFGARSRPTASLTAIRVRIDEWAVGSGQWTVPSFFLITSLRFGVVGDHQIDELSRDDTRSIPNMPLLG